MMKYIIAFLAWWAASKATSAALRYRAAKDLGDSHMVLKQSDRLGSAIGTLAFLGVLGGFALSRRMREKLDAAIKNARLPHNVNPSNQIEGKKKKGKGKEKEEEPDDEGHSSS